jgi:hypothetical protein
MFERKISCEECEASSRLPAHKGRKNNPFGNTERKYFRIIAEVIVDGRNLSQLLIDSHLADPYSVGTKTKDWWKI